MQRERYDIARCTVARLDRRLSSQDLQHLTRFPTLWPT
ncbi:hypothetical protein J2Y63_006194 [Shinella sp. BE166]